MVGACGEQCLVPVSHAWVGGKTLLVSVEGNWTERDSVTGSFLSC